MGGNTAVRVGRNVLPAHQLTTILFAQLYAGGDECEADAGDLAEGFANERSFRTALASGYMLRAKTEGWKQLPR